MTTLLTKAFEKVSALPDTMQDAIAMELLEEIEWEQEWDKTLAKSSKELDILAEKALREFKQGKTSEMGFDDL